MVQPLWIEQSSSAQDHIYMVQGPRIELGSSALQADAELPN